jgi:hypothetical protein
MVGTGITSASITDWVFDWCVGVSADRVLLSNNTSSSNPIDRGQVSNCYYDCASDTVVRPKVAVQNEAGGNSNLTTSLFGIMNSNDTAITNTGTNNNLSGVDFTVAPA